MPIYGNNFQPLEDFADFFAGSIWAPNMTCLELFRLDCKQTFREWGKFGKIT